MARKRSTLPPLAVVPPADTVPEKPRRAPRKKVLTIQRLDDEPTLRLLPTPEPPPPTATPAAARSRRRAKPRNLLPTVTSSGWMAALADRLVDAEVDARMRQIPTAVNEYGYDSWGLHPGTARYGYSLFARLYRHYWRVQTYGIEHVPPGRVLLIGNHSGQLPIDGAMVSVAMLLEANPPRLCRAMVERWFTTMPLLGNFIQRSGAIVGDPLNCERLLQKGEAILVFPEGARGSGKVWKNRYKLVRFGLGFMRLALATNTPIVPFGVVGGEEQAPSFVDFKPLARLLGMPYFPITPTFPWLGVLGMIPFPTKYRIHFGEPLIFRGDPDDRDEVIQRKVDRVKREIRRLIDRGLEEREGIFF
ncbi:lysophospholipid acyltransferase family protein [Chloracidobacterium aggregatum]|uniref:lysophospholipid acyltransferase family protein n=1 Tax=Chloracidobacterium aggregatum TaxID=2851959 RepID=UPI001FE7B50E|nr:lysophospholipid acyltransferase family protein [Chloracidobacterium aggregatum]